MISNNEIKRKKFKVEEIFTTLYRGKNVSHEEGTSEKRYPYVGATYNNNGVVNYVDYSENVFVSKGNSIVFIATGEGSVGYAIYKAEDFVASKNVFVGTFDSLTKNIGNYIVTLINNQTDRYSYGYIRNINRLYNETLLLPVNDKNEPDWEYMEIRGQNIFSEKKEKTINYLKNKREKMESNIKKINLKQYNKNRWYAFNLLNFFEAKRGNQSNMASLENGTIPLVSAKKFNNGYKDFVLSPDKKLYKGNIITLNNDGDGGAGIAYYQPYNMALDTHVTALYPLINMNKYHLLFITRTITHQRDKFGNNYPINDLRLKALKILLPVDDKNEPDWNYMEDYMKKIEYEKISKVLEFIN